MPSPEPQLVLLPTSNLVFHLLLRKRDKPLISLTRRASISQCRVGQGMTGSMHEFCLLWLKFQPRASIHYVSNHELVIELSKFTHNGSLYALSGQLVQDLALVCPSHDEYGNGSRACDRVAVTGVVVSSQRVRAVRGIFTVVFEEHDLAVNFES